MENNNIKAPINGIDPVVYDSNFIKPFQMNERLFKSLKRLPEMKYPLTNFDVLITKSDEQEKYLANYSKENKNNYQKIDALLGQGADGSVGMHLFASSSVLAIYKKTANM